MFDSQIALLKKGKFQCATILCSNAENFEFCMCIDLVNEVRTGEGVGEVGQAPLSSFV